MKAWFVLPHPHGLLFGWNVFPSQWHFGSTLASYTAAWSHQHCFPLSMGKEGLLLFFIFVSCFLYVVLFVYASIHKEAPNPEINDYWVVELPRVHVLFVILGCIRAKCSPLNYPAAWASPRALLLLTITQGISSGGRITAPSERREAACQERQCHFSHISPVDQERQFLD